jgi:hypothetical protein
MPKNKVSDPITDQEIAFARLVLSGTMTDRDAAQTVGLNPDSAAYTKSKPRVRAYMQEHRVAVQQQLVQQDVNGLHRLNLERERVLARLWEIAYLSPEMTRGSMSSQVKAIAMIIAMQNFIPDRRATPNLVIPSAAEGPSPAKAQIYVSEWLREQQAKTPAPPVPPVPPAPPVPACRGAWRGAHEEAQQEDSPPNPGPGQSTLAQPLSPSQAAPGPYSPGFSFVPDARGSSVPDTRVPFSIKKNPIAHPR